MKIAQIAPIILRVPPPERGGTEKIVYDLTEELVRRQHDVTLFATKNARTSARLIASQARPLARLQRAGWPKGTLEYLNMHHFIEAIERASTDYDVIHVHFNQFALPVFKITSTPVLITYHFPINQPVHRTLLRDDHYYPVAISRAHKRGLRGIAGVVYNGVNLKEIPFVQTPSNYWVVAGRITPEKGIYEAIQICRKLNKPLYIVGHVYPGLEKSRVYFEKKVKPFLNTQIQHIDDLSHTALLRLMAKAECLVFPIQWEEPFGLVMIEAMAGGTPVLAFRRGSVPEVVRHGTTGFVVRTVTEAVRFGKKIPQLNRAACRSWVEHRYSIQAMTDAYLKLYKHIIHPSK